MLSLEELKEIAVMKGDGGVFVSLYLNVDPATNPGGEFAIWFKNARKGLQATLGKDELKKADRDLDEMNSYVQGNKREFKRGLAYISSAGAGFKRLYNLNVPVKSDLVVDKMPYLKPLFDMIDNYRRYALLLLDKESARIFLVHMGEVSEFAHMHTPDVPGRHKKGGWFALSQNNYERHIEHHVGLHLKDAVSMFEKFLKGEDVDRVVLCGAEDAIKIASEKMPRAVAEKVMGSFAADMSWSASEVFEKARPVLRAYEDRIERETVQELVTRAMKSDRAVIGLEGVLNALNRGSVSRMVMERDYAAEGVKCTSCSALWVGGQDRCGLCGAGTDGVKYIVELAAQRAVEQGGTVEVVSPDAGLGGAGRIGAFLRF